jgi:hypothetical protein
MTETPPPPDRHPRTKLTRLPYVVVVIAALLVAALWGAMTMRERATSPRSIEQAAPDAPAR